MKNYFYVLMTLLFFQSFLFVEATSAADRYHTVTLEITPGIELYGLSPGEFVMEDGDHLHLQFRPKCPTATASNVTLLVDGVETAFKDFGGRSYFNYMINPVCKDHKVKISAADNIVTIPEVEGARMMPSAGEYAVHYGESYRFSILPDAPLDGKVVKVYANGVELKQDLEGPTLMIYPEPLNYVIESVTEPVKITVEGFAATTTVTLPKLEGARMSPSAGEHKVTIGETFRFCILPDTVVDAEKVKVYANGVELPLDLDGPSLLTYPEPLNYEIENVTEPVTITVEGFVTLTKSDVKNTTTVTLPELECANLMPSAGKHEVEIGESFRFSILPDFFVGTQNVKVYANGVELKQDMEGPSILIYPAPLNYVIEKVTEPVTITVEGFVAHLNAGNSTTITLPSLEGAGARMMPSAGEYDVAIGESFRFSILPDVSVVTDNVKVYANGVELEQDLESPSILIYPAPMNYMIKNVTEPVTIKVEGFIAHMDATSNLQINDGGIQIGADKGVLNISSAEVINVKVYNVSGQQVANCDVIGSEQISLQPGIYIVRAAAQTEKVVIP